MTITVYNTLARKKVPLFLRDPSHVKLYVCGITVYDYCHIGHARVFCAFDVMVRYLRYRGYEVTYVRNITDIDDKIIQRAADSSTTWEELTTVFIEAMHEDMGRLGIQTPSSEPKATEYIPQMIDLIQALQIKKHAYVASDGDVYYDTASFANYGHLSGQHLEKLRAGNRVAVAEAKHDALDFVLWKLAKPGEPSWPSPWGLGRPGWHIECSAMSLALFGDYFDCHGGGGDLLFPHHENEIAQSEGVKCETVVDYWMHVGFVQVDEEKMSKSLGNFFTIRDVLSEWEPEVLRYFLIASHYRSPLNYSTSGLQQAQSALQRLYTALQDCQDDASLLPDASYVEKFNAAMDDDFNTPEALAVLFEVAKALNRSHEQSPQRTLVLARTLRYLGNVLGLLERTEFNVFKNKSEADLVHQLLEKRKQARLDKNWKLADEVRSEIEQLGFTIEDVAGGEARVVFHGSLR